MSHHDENGAEHVRALIEGQRIAMLATVTDDGTIASRPMTTQQVDADCTVWFLALASSDAAAEIRRNPQVNLAFTEEGRWVSLAGRASVLEDPQRARELWDDSAQAWFQCEPDDPKVGVVRVDAESAEFWDTPGKVGTLVAMVKTKVTGERPDIGGSGSIEL